MAGINQPDAQNMERIIDTFGWELVPRLEEDDFGAWYDGQWSHLICGTSKHVEVRYAGKRMRACHGCFEKLIHDAAMGFPREEHVLFGRGYHAPTCYYRGDPVISGARDARGCRECSFTRYRYVEDLWLRFRLAIAR